MYALSYDLTINSDNKSYFCENKVGRYNVRPKLWGHPGILPVWFCFSWFVQPPVKSQKI